jgi:ABC-type multidrug transport system ATPase subunit
MVADVSTPRNDTRHVGVPATRNRAGVELHDLRYAFGRHQALDGIDLSVGNGVLGLLGPNGAGKTTLLRVLATVLKTSEGSIRLLGRDPYDAGELREIRRRLGYLPQQFGYYPNFTVFEFIEYFALLKEMPPRRVRTAVARSIERVGLEDKARARLKSLSGGMLRRVGIAQAIVNDPQLILLDEPTAGLDPEQRVRFRTLLREVAANATVIVSTHLVEDVAAACDEVALMEQGRIVFSGTPVDLSALGTTVDDDLTAQGQSPIERGYGAALTSARDGRNRPSIT